MREVSAFWLRIGFHNQRGNGTRRKPNTIDDETGHVQALWHLHRYCDTPKALV